MQAHPVLTYSNINVITAYVLNKLKMTPCSECGPILQELSQVNPAVYQKFMRMQQQHYAQMMNSQTNSMNSQVNTGAQIGQMNNMQTQPVLTNANINLATADVLNRLKVAPRSERESILQELSQINPALYQKCMELKQQHQAQKSIIKSIQELNLSK